MNPWLLLLLIPAIVVIGGAIYLWKSTPRKEKPLPGKRRIACIGDSITFGTGVVMRRETKAWTYILGRMLGDSFQVLNYGIPGATALLESEVMYKEAHDFVDAAVQAEPEAYLLMLGTNDAKTVNWCAEDFYRDYNRMIDRMQSGSPAARIVLMTPATAFPNPKAKDGSVAFGIDAHTVHSQTAPIVRQIAQERSLPIIDIHNFTEGHPDWFNDGIHPNAEGNMRLAEFIFQRIVDTLG